MAVPLLYCLLPWAFGCASAANPGTEPESCSAVGRTLAELFRIKLALQEYVGACGSLPPDKTKDGTTWGYWLLWGNKCSALDGWPAHRLRSQLDPSLMSRPRDVEILDIYGNPFSYRVGEDGHFRLYSSGPNGIDEGGLGDDLSERSLPGGPKASSWRFPVMAALMAAGLVASAVLWFALRRRRSCRRPARSRDS